MGQHAGCNRYDHWPPVASVKNGRVSSFRRCREPMVYFNRNSTGGKPEVIQSTLAFAVVVFVLVVTSLMIAPGADGLLGAYLAALMLGIACNDARHYLIPNELTAAAFGIALLRGLTLPNASATLILWPVFRASAVSLPLFFLLLFYRHWRGRDGLGLGGLPRLPVPGSNSQRRLR